MAIHQNKRFCGGRKADPEPRVAFRGRALPPSEKYVPSSEYCAQKESNRAGATGVHFGACTSKILLVIPSSVGKVLLQDEKHK